MGGIPEADTKDQLRETKEGNLAKASEEESPVELAKTVPPYVVLGAADAISCL